jgi:uncharacterized RDD family membrane protein YckC
MEKNALQYVGYSRRASALFIDSIWWTIVALFIPVGPDVSLNDPTGVLALFSWSTLGWITLAQCIPLLLTGVLWTVWGTSPGKRLLGLRIVDADTGYPMSPLQAALRTLGYLICFGTFGLGFLPMFFSEKKQGLHDMMANTVVVEKAVLSTVEFPARKQAGNSRREPRAARGRDRVTPSRP